MAYVQDQEDKKAKPFITATTPQAIPAIKPPTAPKVAQGQYNPLNQQYNVMKGLMSTKQSSAAINPEINQIAEEGTTGVKQVEQEATDYTKANKRTTQTPEQIQADYEAYKINPASEGGQRYSQSLAGGTVTGAPQFTSGVGYINPAQVTVPTMRGGNVGNRLLDTSLMSPAQQRMKAMVTGTANQNIADIQANTAGLQKATTAANQTVTDQQQQAALNLQYIADRNAAKLKDEADKKAAEDKAISDAAIAKKAAEDKAISDAAIAKKAAIDAEIRKLSGIPPVNQMTQPSGALNIQPQAPTIEERAITNVDASNAKDTLTPAQREAIREKQYKDMMGGGSINLPGGF